jgi:hypothetical protein
MSSSSFVVWINVTSHPTAEWIAQRITEAFPWNEAPRYLIRDRDQVYGAAATRRLTCFGLIPSPDFEAVRKPRLFMCSHATITRVHRCSPYF